MARRSLTAVGVLNDGRVSVSSRWLTSDVPRGSDYDERWTEMARRGQAVHGEANFVSVFQPRTVLDAGCGTGRVAIELATRGVDTAGVDVDPQMLQVAVQKAPHLRWFHGDLAEFVLVDADGQLELFDVIVAAGNVMIFLAPGSERRAIRQMSEHLVSGGVLIAGFQLSSGGLDLGEYDRHCDDAGLELTERYSTWSHDPYLASSPYAVSVHRRPRLLG